MFESKYLSIIATPNGFFFQFPLCLETRESKKRLLSKIEAKLRTFDP